MNLKDILSKLVGHGAWDEAEQAEALQVIQNTELPDPVEQKSDEKTTSKTSAKG